MNITHLVENLNRGGLERMVLELAKLQHAQGHRCQIVCLFESGSLAHELDGIGVPVHACEKRRGVDLRALLRLRRLVRDHNTDVLHTHNAVAHYHGVLAAVGLTNRNLKIRMVINTRHSMIGSQRSSRREWLYRLAVDRTDAVITVCDAARRDAVDSGIVPLEKTHVVPNGIHVTAFQPTSAGMRERLHQALDLQLSIRLIGTVGRLTAIKNQAGLIRAFALTHREQPDTALLLIGDGVLRQSLEQYASDEGVAGSVHFLGDRSDVHELLQGLDLFVLSSLSEGYSMALLEACAVALPIVATDVGGNGEIVREGSSGMLVPSSDPPALAAAMLALLTDSRQAAALGAGARAWVELHGSLDTMASRYAQLYQARWVAP